MTPPGSDRLRVESEATRLVAYCMRRADLLSLGCRTELVSTVANAIGMAVGQRAPSDSVIYHLRVSLAIAARLADNIETPMPPTPAGIQRDDGASAAHARALSALLTSLLACTACWQPARAWLRTREAVAAESAPHADARPAAGGGGLAGARCIYPRRLVLHAAERRHHRQHQHQHQRKQRRHNDERSKC